ncbi:polysaccharide lyase family protein [Spirillospora sp. NPDC050679]
MSTERRAALRMPLAAAAPGGAPGPAPVRRLRAAGEIGRVRLTWEGEAYRPLVDHYAIYASRTRGFKVGPDTLLAKTVYATFPHDRLGGRRQDWYYRIVTVDASGARSRPSAEVAGHSLDSVAVTGRALASVGEFDHKSLEFALAPAGTGQYRARFPNGVDYTAGTSRPGTDWCYIQPGPADAWGGSKPSRFTLRFTLADAPAEAWASIWLIDTHGSQPGTIELALNGAPVREVKLENGAMRGSLEGDATAPGNGLKPSYVELELPRAALRTGENVLTIDKKAGSWHAYDALGVFERAR